MKHKLVIQAFAGLYFFSLLSSVVHIFVEFSFNPFIFYIFLFALLIVFFILYFWLKPKFKALEAKKHLWPYNKRRLLLGINIFLVFRHFDFTKK